MSLFAELKRRNVFRVGAAYAVAAWVLVQIGEAVFPAFGVPDSLFRGPFLLRGQNLHYNDLIGALVVFVTMMSAVVTPSRGRWS